jgi:hypothetical protein
MKKKCRPHAPVPVDPVVGRKPAGQPTRTPTRRPPCLPRVHGGSRPPAVEHTHGLGEDGRSGLFFFPIFNFFFRKKIIYYFIINFNKFFPILFRNKITNFFFIYFIQLKIFFLQNIRIIYKFLSIGRLYMKKFFIKYKKKLNFYQSEDYIWKNFI